MCLGLHLHGVFLCGRSRSSGGCRGRSFPRYHRRRHFNRDLVVPPCPHDVSSHDEDWRFSGSSIPVGRFLRCVWNEEKGAVVEEARK